MSYIYIYIKMCMYMSASLFSALFIMKKRSLEHLLSMMTAFQSLWPSTMVSCFLLLVAVSSTFQRLRLHQHVYENRDLESVRHTTTTHTTTHNDAHQHTTKHTSKTPITHHKHTAHTHTTHIHRTPSKSKHVRTRKMVNCAWWGHIFVESRDDTDVQIVTFRSACFPQDRWSWTIFYQVKRMIGGIGNMLFSTSPNFKMGKVPHKGEPMVKSHFSKIMN